MIAFSFLNAYKNLWLLGVAAVLLSGGFVAYKNHEAKKIAAAVASTRAEISVGAVEAVSKTAAAEREALETTPIPASKAEILERCKRSASCRERNTLK